MFANRALLIAALLAASSTRPTLADDARKPMLFFVGGGSKIDLGDSYAETEYGKVRAQIRTRMTSALAKTFGTNVIDHEFKSDRPSGAELASACAQSGAIGVIESLDAVGHGKDDTYRGAFTLYVRDCVGSTYFSETGVGVHGPGKAEMADVLIPAMEDAYARLQKDVDDSPKASANYERYGIYMTSADTDSFWLPTIDGKTTVVDECEPVGTASRAGLRVGDEIRSIDGVPTVGLDFDALNAAMSHAIGEGSWTLEVANKDKTVRTITFENKNVAWYAAHPLDPATIPPPRPLRAREQRVPLTFIQ